MVDTSSFTLASGRRLLLSLWLPLLIIIVGYGIAYHVANLRQQENDQRILQDLEQRLQQISTGVKEKVTLYQYGLRGLRGAMVTHGAKQFDYVQMQKYTLSRDYVLEFPGARGFGFIQYVNQTQLPLYLAKAAQDRPDKRFNLRQLNPHDDSLFIIRYIEPEERNKEAVGLDIGSEQNRRQAALRAARENAVALTGPITLVQASQKSLQGFLILMPVYSDMALAQNAEHRMDLLVGWSYAPILIDEVLNDIAGLHAKLVLSISDVTQDAAQNFFTRGEKDLAQQQFKTEHTISLFGRNWQLSLSATPDYINALALPDKRSSLLNLWLISLFIALLVFSIQLVLLRRSTLARHKKELVQAEENALILANNQLEQQVAERTAQLQQMGALQSSILSSAAYAIIATDPEGIITVFNPHAELLLGYSAAEMIGKLSPAVFHDAAEGKKRADELSEELGVHIEAGFEAFVAKARDGKVDINNWTYIHKTGKRIPVKLSVTALRNEEGTLNGFLGIAYDLSVQLAREHDLAAAREQALQANRAKSDFLANMSHEIRTPMNAILGLLQITLNTSLSKPQQDYLLKTQHAAKSLLLLLNDILDFSKIEAGKLELEHQPFAIQQVLEDIAILLSSQAQRKNIELIYQVANDVPARLMGDSLRVRQILLNLIGNAIKFTEHGEVLTRIELTANNAERCTLQITVKDSGIGMTKEQQKLIFDDFQQAESSISRHFGGSGLGLAIVKRLLTMMDGDIQVSSTIGKGSTFTVTLTLDRCEQETTMPQLPENLNILLVEDNEASALVICDMLQRLAARVTHCTSASEALTVLSDTGTAPFDICLLDWQLPDEDGMVLAQKIRALPQLNAQPHIVLITAFSERLLEQQLQLTSSTHDATLIKPITPEVLAGTLHKVLSSNNLTRANEQNSISVKQQDTLLGRTILLVEDNPTNRLVATTLLSSLGAEVTEAYEGNAALQLLQDKAFDVVLMDIQMPGMDGYETTRRIRQQLKLTTLPIIAMTANAMPQDKEACLAAGMNDHITKPFDIDDVAKKILGYLPEKQASQPAGTQIIAPQNTKAEFYTRLEQFSAEHKLDLPNAYQRLGDKQLYTRVINQYLLDLQLAAKTLSVSSIAVQQARLLYHSLKSGAASCGLSQFAELLQQAEQHSNQTQDNAIATDAAVRAALPTALQQLQALSQLLAGSEQPEQPPTLSSDTTTDIASQLNLMQQLLTQSNMKALQIFNLLQPELQQRSAVLTAQLQHCLEQLDFSTASSVLLQLQTAGELNNEQ